MATRKIKRPSGKPLNIYAVGGTINTPQWGQLYNQQSLQNSVPTGNFNSGTNINQATSGGSGIANIVSSLGGAGGVAGIASFGLEAINNLFGDDGQYSVADTTAYNQALSDARNTTINYQDTDSLLNAWTSYNPVDEVSWRDLYSNSGGTGVKAASSAVSGAAAGASLGPIGAGVGAGVGAVVGGLTSLFGNQSRKKKAKRKARNSANELNANIENLNSWVTSSLNNSANNIQANNMYNNLANFSAYGGFIPTVGSNALSYDLAVQDLANKTLEARSKSRTTTLPNYGQGNSTFAEGGGIHIKKKNRGKFTNWAKDRGLSVGEATSKVLANPDNYSEGVRKMAQFSRNFGGHAMGGHLHNPQSPYLLTMFAEGGNLRANIPNEQRNGGLYSNGVMKIDAGGTHEDNPFGGVPMGVDPEGTPNLVEQGEVVFNDYVFSNRLFATGGDLKDSLLPKRYKNHSFAKIAEDLSNESSERPYDHISQNGLRANMAKLQGAQERVRERRAPRENNEYASGGNLATYAQYAPAVDSGIQFLQDIFGGTNRPDYSNADMIYADQVSPNVGVSNIGERLTYQPLDRNYYANQLRSQAGATRRALTNTSGGNRAQLVGSLLAADYNYGNQLGDLTRMAEEYNTAQRAQVADFNRGTSLANRQLALQAQQTNSNIALQNAQLATQARIAQAQFREDIDRVTSANRSQNRSNFFTNIGNIGREQQAYNMINSNPALYYGISNSGNVSYTGNNTRAKGGKMNKRRMSYGK